MKTLHITLQKKWFDMTDSGEKTDEYRKIKPYWIQRLCWHEYHNLSSYEIIAKALSGEDIFKRNFDFVEAVNGYGSSRPRWKRKFISIKIGRGHEAWGAPEDFVFIIKLGEKI